LKDEHFFYLARTDTVGEKLTRYRLERHGTVYPDANRGVND
jgi:hypothetical protein